VRSLLERFSRILNLGIDPERDCIYIRKGKKLYQLIVKEGTITIRKRNNKYFSFNTKFTVGIYTKYCLQKTLTYIKEKLNVE